MNYGIKNVFTISRGKFTSTLYLNSFGPTSDDYQDRKMLQNTKNMKSLHEKRLFYFWDERGKKVERFFFSEILFLDSRNCEEDVYNYHQIVWAFLISLKWSERVRGSVCVKHDRLICRTHFSTQFCDSCDCHASSFQDDEFIFSQNGGKISSLLK